ncbi:cell division protein ZipA [Shewanella psychrotolerans]|uniref:cell division protein ZipA n=1 Tax=Shewanella psychrotolerans TaxID=2864206 RepID=UPI001C65E88C|nr:cell division protein ZipA [Shewanella psychrotolerans]QYK02727.1 cell division protein ZipA [Shewanella psychrotolerans]
MENLQLVLSVLGAIAIIAVLVHGFWSIKRQQPKPLKETRMTGFNKEQNRDRDGFDADGIGAVRVRKLGSAESLSSAETEQANPTHLTKTSSDIADEHKFSLSDEPKRKAPRQRQEPTLLDSSTDDIEQMELGLGQVPAQPSLFEDPVCSRKPEQAKPKSKPVAPEALKPTSVEAEVQIAQAEAELSVESQLATEEVKEEPLGDPQDVLVLHVVAEEGEHLNGAELLPSLLTLHFKFGEMDIFHRHEDNAGTGKVLFSLANMVKPGVFNPDEMEQFTTQGIVLFMTLPCYGDALMNFSNMLNSAHQLADDLGGVLLDGARSPWNEQKKQAYLQRIRAQA